MKIDLCFWVGALSLFAIILLGVMWAIDVRIKKSQGSIGQARGFEVKLNTGDTPVRPERK